MPLSFWFRRIQRQGVIDLKTSLTQIRRRFAGIPEVWEALGRGMDVDIRSLHGSGIPAMQALLRLGQFLIAGLPRENSSGIDKYLAHLTTVTF
jgi:hypothetical protein